MTATLRTLVMEQGATFSLGFTAYEDGPVVDGVVTAGDPVDLTDCHMRMQVRQAIGRPALITADDTDFITLGPAGRVDILIPDETMDALNVRSGVWDLKLELANGTEEWLFYGPVTNRLAVTLDADFTP